MHTADSLAQLITVLLLCVAVLWAAWFVTRWIAGVQRGGVRGGALEVMEACRIGPNQTVEIIRVANRYVAIAVSKDSVEKLCELGPEEYTPRAAGVAEQASGSKASFRALLESLNRKDSMDDKAQG